MRWHCGAAHRWKGAAGGNSCMHIYLFYAHILSRPGLMVSATLYGVKLDVLSVSFSVRVFLTIGPCGYSSSVPCIGATGRKRANTGSTRSLPVRGTLDGFGPLSRISLVGLGLPAHKRLLSRLKHSSITTRPRSLPSARTRLNRRNQPSHLQHLALLSSPRSTTWTFVA